MTTKSNLWDHLPAAKHIDRIDASVNQHRDIWKFACDKWYDLVSYELRARAYDEARAKCKELDRWDIWCDLSIPHSVAF